MRLERLICGWFWVGRDSEWDALLKLKLKLRLVVKIASECLEALADLQDRSWYGFGESVARTIELLNMYLRDFTGFINHSRREYEP